MNIGGALVTFRAGDLGGVRVTLEAWVEKRAYFWTVIPTSLGTGRGLHLHTEVQERHHTLILKSQVSQEHMVLSVG